MGAGGVMLALAIVLGPLGALPVAWGSDSECNPSELAPAVTTCAKRVPEFLKCISAASMDAGTQCRCMLQSPAMMRCVGSCLTLARVALCGETPETAMPHAPASAVSGATEAVGAAANASQAGDAVESNFMPSTSKFLQYRGETMPLKGISGMYVINLKRRSDRLQEFFRSSGLARTDVHIQEAFDGRQLVWSDGLATLFGRSKFGRKRGVIGCALSHFAIWRHVATTENQYHIIFEDDAQLVPNFVELWNTQYYYAQPLDVELAMLGGVAQENLSKYREERVLEGVTRLFARHRATDLFSHEHDAEVDRGTAGEPSRAFHYHAMGYLVSSIGARNLVDFVIRHGFLRPVDAMLLKFMRQTPRVYAAYPPLIESPVFLYNRVHGGDSDANADATPVQDQKQPAPRQQLEVGQPQANQDRERADDDQSNSQDELHQEL